MNAVYEETSLPLLTITSIGEVSGTDYLKSLPDGSVDLVIPTTVDGITVTRIKAKAFNNFTSLLSVILPDGIDGIVGSSFQGCKFLKSVTLPNAFSRTEPWIYQSAFDGCTSLTDINLTHIYKIVDYAFRSCTSLESIDIPSSVTSIAANSFMYCNNLKTINIDKAKNSIALAYDKWGATNATINWLK